MSKDATLELRRLYRILMMPIVDIRDASKSKEDQEPLGYRSILNKSIRRLDSGSIRNILLKLAHMCPENDIKSFVDN